MIAQSHEPRGAGVRGAVGWTPLIRLERLFSDAPFQLLAKLELCNPNAGTMDRLALRILQAGLDSGAIDGDSVIVEPTCGDLAIALAQACRHFGLRFICVSDPEYNGSSRRIIEALGASVVTSLGSQVTPEEQANARMARTREILQSVPKAHYTNECGDFEAAVYRSEIMPEIMNALSGTAPAFVFCPASVGGALRGCLSYIREHRLCTRLVGATLDARTQFREAPGCLTSPTDYGWARVRDIDCIKACRRLIGSEAILCGACSGAVLAAIERTKREIPAGALCVAILPDRGERYLETIYAEDWAVASFGAVPGI